MAIFICIINSFMAQRPRHTHSWGFLITLRHTTRGRTPLGDWSARRRDLYLTTHNILDIHVPHGIQTRSPSKWAAADRRLRQRGHWDGRVRYYRQLNKMINIQASIRWNKLQKWWLSWEKWLSIHLWKTHPMVWKSSRLRYFKLSPTINSVLRLMNKINVNSPTLQHKVIVKCCKLIGRHFKIARS